jgi:phenylacetate-CoA ligase
MTDDLELTVIMPALNEAERIEAAVSKTLRAMDDFRIAGELIVVNDGSRDGTPDIVTRLMEGDGRVRLLTHDSPQGIGASFWDGFELARGKAVCMFPGDDENDPWEALRYFILLEHVDIVVPFVFNKETRSLFRNALSFVYRFIINTTFLVNFNYTNGTVLYRKSVLDGLRARSTGFFFQTDILVRTVKEGYLFAEVPYRLGLRAAGKSKATTFPSLVAVVKGYIRLVKDTYGRKEHRVTRRYAAGSSTDRRRSAARYDRGDSGS